MGPKQSKLASAQSSMRSRPFSGRPTSFETMVTGRCWASSVAASKVPFATRRSTRPSASSLMVSRTAARACGVSGPPMTLRIAACSSPSAHRTIPMSVWFIRSFIITPCADENTGQLRSASRQSPNRASAYIPCASSQTAPPRSRRAW